MSSTEEQFKDDHVVIDVVLPPPTRRSTKESLIQQQAATMFAKDLVHQAIEDAGRWAYGILLVELWALQDDGTKLYRPDGGAWLDPVCGDSSALCRLTDPSFEGYVGPEPLAPGVGLPGVLWNEASTGTTAAPVSMNLMPGKGKSARSSPTNQRKVVWRDVNFLAADPDQPANPRLQVLAEAGLGWAAAVPFDVGGKQGIVVYMAREGVNHRRLQSPSNEIYLAASADLIGSAYALRRPRRSVILERTNECAKAIVRARAKLLSLIHMGVTIAELAEPPKKSEASQEKPDGKETSTVGKAFTFLKHKAVATAKKTIHGGGNQPPPAFDIKQTLLTFLGSFLTLLALTNLNVHMIETYGRDYLIVLGPFGALMTLQYGLTAAPASQPRNALIGQSIALTISILISKADSLEPYMKQSLATSLAVACMVKLGITHPPAGATALIFSSGQFEWTHMLMILTGYVIAICTAMIWNNLQDKRQYPTYYGLGCITRLLPQSDKEKEV